MKKIIWGNLFHIVLVLVLLALIFLMLSRNIDFENPAGLLVVIDNSLLKSFPGCII